MKRKQSIYLTSFIIKNYLNGLHNRAFKVLYAMHNLNLNHRLTTYWYYHYYYKFMVQKCIEQISHCTIDIL